MSKRIKADIGISLSTKGLNDMNREQKRALVKNKKARKLLELMLMDVERQKAETSIPEGAKVRLRYDRIHGSEMWNDLSQRYKDFVEENKGKEFTVEYDERFKDRPLVVCLKEDPSETKWLFNVLDLEVVK